MKGFWLALLLISTICLGGCGTEQIKSDNFEWSYLKTGNCVIVTKSLDYESTYIEIPENIDGKPVKVIGDNAFYQHTNAISISLPETLTEIQGSAFYRCYALKSINIPKNVERIDDQAFFRCSSLENIFVDNANTYFADIDGVLYSKDIIELIAYPEGKSDKSFTVPASVRKINPGFGHYPHLKILIIPETVTEMPDYNMFVYPDDITLVVKESSVAEEYAIRYNLKYELM